TNRLRVPVGGPRQLFSTITAERGGSLAADMRLHAPHDGSLHFPFPSVALELDLDCAFRNLEIEPVRRRFSLGPRREVDELVEAAGHRMPFRDGNAMPLSVPCDNPDDARLRRLLRINKALDSHTKL